jgi:rhomboid protease GluP
MNQMVSSIEEIGLEDEAFYSSSKKLASRKRVWLGLGIVAGFLLIAAGLKSVTLTIVTATICLSTFLLIEYLLRRALRPGKPLIILNKQGIESPNFQGKIKQYPWKEIEDVSIDSFQNNTFIRFQLGGAKLSEKPSLFASRRKPAISLYALEPDQQERLLDSVIRRIRMQSASQLDRPIVNHFAAEREFQAELKALAPHAWITYGLIAINLLIWCFTLTKGAHLMETPVDRLLDFGGNNAFVTQHGEWWRLLSATFLHSGFLHVFMNMVGLYGAGVTVERIYGHRSYLLIYLGSGLMGSALSLHFSAQNSISVGASGAVFGVAGALLVVVLQHKKNLPSLFGSNTISSIGFFIVYALIHGFSKVGIDNAAHVGGLIGGGVLAAILPARFNLDSYRQKLTGRSTAALLALVIGVAFLYVSTPQSSMDPRQVFASKAFLEKAVQEFDTGIKALQKEAADVKAGKMSERESDERSRTVYAPMFKQVSDDLSHVVLLPGDKRAPFLKDIQRLADLLHEVLAMPTIVDHGGKSQPADPARVAAINKEAAEIGQRIHDWKVRNKVDPK